MYEVIIKKSFSAAHLLKGVDGMHEELHGHNFAVEVSVISPELNPDGILIDFRTLKKWLNDIIEDFDHKYLNDMDCFKGMNPSTEIIAKFIFGKMAEKTYSYQLEISRVTVWESEDAGVSYCGIKQ